MSFSLTYKSACDLLIVVKIYLFLSFHFQFTHHFKTFKDIINPNSFTEDSNSMYLVYDSLKVTSTNFVCQQRYQVVESLADREAT